MKSQIRYPGNRELIPVPEEQKNFIRETCKDCFKRTEELHSLWEMAMNVACGIDERFLPTGAEYDFDTEFLQYITLGDREKDDVQRMLDILDMLRWNTTRRGYYEATANIKQVIDVIEWALPA